MSIQRVSCASCGAPIKIPADVDRLNCTYCGAGLIVRRGEGYVALKLAEQINNSILDTGTQTQSTIREGTQVTQAELKRLQLSQELSAAQIQLSSIQAEIRGLERQKRNRQINQQLKELRNQESTFLLQIRNLRETLTPTGSKVQSAKVQVPPTQPILSPTVMRSCLTGCGVFFIVAFVCVGGLLAIPLDQLIFGVQNGSQPTGTSKLGPFAIAAECISFIAGVIAFAYTYSPHSQIWKPFKERLDVIRGAPNKADASGNRICLRCQTSNDASDKFCIKCGNQLTS